MEEKKLRYLNVGCGNKFHSDWVNIDMVSYHPDVIEHNVLSGLPFPEDYFDVVYHSQVLEHIPKNKANDFLAECFRVLKPGGIIRIVLPDLENIVREYQRHLESCLSDGDKLSEANYDWILLEMYDQAVRNSPGGQMAAYIQKPVLINEEYVFGRIGHVGRLIRSSYLESLDTPKEINASILEKYIGRIVRNFKFSKIRKRIVSALLTGKEREFLKIGQFRNGGEIHYCMYDRFSLSRLLRTIGFTALNVLDPYRSDILNWSQYELDVKDSHAYDPTSLFVEARKPVK
nr:methyltransferase domain-containing protein [uncultured Dyadobacter sp.]